MRVSCLFASAVGFLFSLSTLQNRETDLKYAGKFVDINLASSLVKILFRLSFACIIYWRVVHYLQRSTSSDFEGVPGTAHDHELMVHRMNKILSFGIVKDPIVSYLILIYVTFLGNPAAE